MDIALAAEHHPAPAGILPGLLARPDPRDRARDLGVGALQEPARRRLVLEHEHDDRRLAVAAVAGVDARPGGEQGVVAAELAHVVVGRRVARAVELDEQVEASRGGRTEA